MQEGFNAQVFSIELRRCRKALGWTAAQLALLYSEAIGREDKGYTKASQAMSKHYFGHSFKPNPLSEAQKLTNMYKRTVIGTQEAGNREEEGVWDTVANRATNVSN
jgi:hypothetical protein